MSTDGNVSKGSGTNEDPDEFDSVVLDEDFVKGGVAEQSLRRYQVVREQRWERPPPAGSSSSGSNIPGSTPDGNSSIPDTAGRRPPGGPDYDRRDSDRRDPGPTGRGSNADPGEGLTSGSGQGRPRSIGLVVGAVALVVALVMLTGLIRLGRGSAGSAGTGNLQGGAQAGLAGGQSVLLSPSLPEGSCFNLPADSTTTNMMVSVVTCSASHQYELIDLQQGTGNNDQYPTQKTWTTTVYNQCSDDLQAYTGQPVAKWPRGLYPAVIPPTKDTWSQGNRTIYCVAAMQSAGTGSVRALNGSGSGPTG